MPATGAPVLVSWSGGKDSALALEALTRSPEWRVHGLLTSISAEFDRVTMHGVRRDLLEAQAAALRLPLIVVELPPNPTNEIYGALMRDALEAVRAGGVNHVAFGDLFLEDVRRYREEALAAIDMKAVFPVWGEPTADLARRFIGAGFRAILSCVDTEQIPGSFAGRAFDPSLLDDLPDTCDPCGERGEFHSFVHDGPIFAHPIPVRTGERVLRENRFMYCDLLAG